MPQILLTYSSKTGNTRMVAEAVYSVLPEHALLCPVSEAPAAEEFDAIIVGFWTSRGGPDPEAAAYMKTLRKCDVGFFGTLAAYPDSEHGRGVIAAARRLLEGNRIIASFLCQGKLPPERMARILSGEAADKNHPLTEERKTRILEAAHHPDARDLTMAKEAFAGFAEAVRPCRTNNNREE